MVCEPVYEACPAGLYRVEETHYSRSLSHCIITSPPPLSLSLSLSVVLNVVVISTQWVGGWQAAPSLRQSFCSVEEKGKVAICTI